MMQCGLFHKPNAGILFLLRHGVTDNDGVKRYIGQTDVPLGASGYRQADRWAQYFAQIAVQRILCSDLQRSTETADIIGRRCRITPEAHSKLREIDLGSWEGMSFDHIRDQYPEEYALRGRDIARYRPLQGESFQDLRRRVVPFWDHQFKQSRENVLFVGHAGVNRILLCHLLGMPLSHLFRLEQDPAALSVIVRKNEYHRVVLLNMGL